MAVGATLLQALERLGQRQDLAGGAAVVAAQLIDYFVKRSGLQDADDLQHQRIFQGAVRYGRLPFVRPASLS